MRDENQTLLRNNYLSDSSGYRNNNGDS